VPLSNDAKVKLMDIARNSLMAKLATDHPIPPPPGEAELHQPAGCFVSLHQRHDHALRGCIGRLEANLPLWQAVQQTAGDVLNDPRFTGHRVTADDIANVEMEISVLSPLKPAPTPLDFEPMNEGMYLVLAGRAGCFLPQVARETGWTKEQLLGRLCTEKMGLPPDAWKHPAAKLFTFNVEVVGPEPL
jgi:AmmeMemoRadiSam system protein A